MRPRRRKPIPVINYRGFTVTQAGRVPGAGVDLACSPPPRPSPCFPLPFPTPTPTSFNLARTGPSRKTGLRKKLGPIPSAYCAQLLRSCADRETGPCRKGDGPEASPSRCPGLRMPDLGFRGRRIGAGLSPACTPSLTGRHLEIVSSQHARCRPHEHTYMRTTYIHARRRQVPLLICDTPATSSSGPGPARRSTMPPWRGPSFWMRP